MEFHFNRINKLFMRFGGSSVEMERILSTGATWCLKGSPNRHSEEQKRLLYMGGKYCGLHTVSTVYKNRYFFPVSNCCQKWTLDKACNHVSPQEKHNTEFLKKSPEIFHSKYLVIRCSLFNHGLLL